MTDINILWNQAEAYGDWTIVGGDLGHGQDLLSSTLVSLFTDRLASPDFVPPDRTGDRRGWWADTFEKSLIGSRLWQLDRAKISNRGATLAQAKGYCDEALAWMIEDGVAAQVNVQTGFIAPTAIGIVVQIIQPDGRQQVFNFKWAWDGIGV